MSNVTRVEPAIAQGAGGFFRSLPVALHDLWTANDNLAIFTGRQLALACLNIHNLLFGIVHGHADTIYTHQRWISRLGMCQWRGLGQPIALHHSDARLLLQLASRVHRQGSCTRKDILDSLQLTEIDWCIGKGQHNGWYSKVVGHTVFLAQIQGLEQVEALHNDLRATAR